MPCLPKFALPARIPVTKAILIKRPGVDIISTTTGHAISFCSTVQVRVGFCRRNMSYNTSSSLRIGLGVYWLNGVLNAALPAEFSGFRFSHTAQASFADYLFFIYPGNRVVVDLAIDSNNVLNS
jgi:hypothetical protein